MNTDYYNRNTEVARIEGDGSLTPTSTEQPDFIAENAAGPRRVQGDSGSVEQHSLQEQIAADKYLLSKKSAKSNNYPLKFFKIAPGGTT
jgi:hypothetical protein